MRYLLSSNSRPLYAQNVLNIMAAPQSSVYHLRYDAKWVAGDYKDPEGGFDSKKLVESLQRDSNALVVYADIYRPGWTLGSLPIMCW